MATKKKLHWSVKTIIIVVSVIIALILAFILFFKLALGIDLFAIKKQVKLISKSVNEQTYITNGYSNTDLKSVGQKLAAAGLEELFSSDKTNFDLFYEYLTADDNTETHLLNNSIMLTDKEIAALINSALINGYSGVEQTEDFSIELKQIKFLEVSSKDYNIYEQTSVKINVIVKMNIKAISNSFKKFPLNLVLGKFPEELYINSTLTIKTENSAFGYTVESDELLINGLSKDETKKFFEVFKFLGLGTYPEIQQEVDKAITDIFIGSDLKSGFITQLSYIGIDTYEFIKQASINYIHLIVE